MGQEYFINDQTLEDKVRQLLPSQGGAGAGFDLSASTQIIPIVDLTESAEGSNIRQDLQTALSFSSATAFRAINSTETIINNTGYYRVFGGASAYGSVKLEIQATDGASTKSLYRVFVDASQFFVENFDFVVFCKAGDSILADSNSTAGELTGVTRQIADIDGNLVNPI